MPINVKPGEGSSEDPFLRLDLSTDADKASVTVTVSFDGDLVKTIGREGETEDEVRLEIAQEILYLIYVEFNRAYDDAKGNVEASA